MNLSLGQTVCGISWKVIFSPFSTYKENRIKITVNLYSFLSYQIKILNEIKESKKKSNCLV